MWGSRKSTWRASEEVCVGGYIDQWRQDIKSSGHFYEKLSFYNEQEEVKKVNKQNSGSACAQ